MGQNTFNPNLPALIALYPNKWLWLKDNKLYTMIIVGVTPGSPNISCIWYEPDGTEHYVANAPHFTNAPTHNNCWVESDPSSGDSGYVRTS